MSLSTTSTRTYSLTKYSRSYPRSQSQATATTQDEWQHFTNPVMTLILDIKSRPSGDLDSYRMRIVWCLDAGAGAGGDAMDVDVGQRDVVFEDLDLLAFSSIPEHSSQQGLPLKAVYRDGIVGIRYMHPRVVPPGATPAYRRIQINFESPDAAKNFVTAIQLVCPCKANPVPPPARAGTKRPLALAHTMVPPPAPPRVPSHLSGATSRETLTTTSTLELAKTQRHPGSTTRSPFGQHIFNPAEQDPSHAPSQSTTSLPVSSSMPRTSLTLQPVGVPQMLPSAVHQYPSSERSLQPGPPSSDLSMLSSDVVTLPPSSTPPTSDPAPQAQAQAAAHPPSQPPLTINTPTATVPSTSTADTAEALLAALRTDTTSTVLALPRAELEHIIAEVVREEGFAALLETMDSMWRLKGLWGTK